MGLRNSFDELKIGSKLSMMGSVSLLAIIVLATFLLIERIGEVRDAGQTMAITSLAETLDAAIGNLQRERGMSAGFIGSGGKKFVAKLPEQRKKADAAIEALRTRSHKLRYDLPAGLKAKVGDVFSTIEQLAAIRGEVDNLNSASFFGFYSGVCQAQIRIIAGSATSIDDADIATKLRAYGELLWLKERSGQERGLVNGMFAGNRGDSAKIGTTMRYISLQKRHFEAFASLAPAELATELRAAEDSDASQAVFEKRAIIKGVLDRLSIASDLRGALGYGGMIHTFKNFIIRGQEKYIARFGEQRDAALFALDALGELGVAAGFEDETTIISQTIERYSSAFRRVISERKAGTGIAAIDRAVAIDDGPALAAIVRLTTELGNVDAGQWFAAASKRLGLFSGVGNQIRALTSARASQTSAAARSAITWLIIAIAVFTITLLVLSSWMRARIPALQLITNRLDGLSRGEYVLETINVSSSGDEIAAIGRSYNGFIGGLGELVERADHIKRGEIDLNEVDEEADDTSTTTAGLATHGALADAFASLESAQRQLATQARAIASGDMNAEVLDRQLTGTVGEAFATMVTILRMISGQATAIAKGNVRDKQLRNSLPGELGKAFADMVAMMRSLGEQTALIAKGDLGSDALKQRLPGILGQDFATMVQALKLLVAEISQAISQVNSAAMELSTTSQEQAASAAEQAASAEETKATMESLRLSAEHIADISHGVVGDAKSAQSNATLIGSKIGEMATHSAGIADILEMIKDIAQKSDMLALNAALEGTKAGESGRGFSLVASQMQRLAGQVMESVKRISLLTADIEKATTSSVLASEEATKLASSTTASAERINMASGQQKSGAAEVSSAMVDIAKGANEAAATVAQVANAAASLEQLSQGVTRSIAHFKL